MSAQCFEKQTAKNCQKVLNPRTHVIESPEAKKKKKHEDEEKVKNIFEITIGGLFTQRCHDSLKQVRSRIWDTTLDCRTNSHRKDCQPVAVRDANSNAGSGQLQHQHFHPGWCYSWILESKCRTLLVPFNARRRRNPRTSE